MSIDAIDRPSSVQRPSALDLYSQFLNAPAAQPQGPASGGSPGQQLMAMLVSSLMAAAQPQQGGGNPWPDTAAGPGSTAGPSGPMGPGTAGNNPQAGQLALINSILQLLQALLPLLQSLAQNGLQPTSAANQLANQFGGGSGGGGGFGSGAGAGGGGGGGGSPFGGMGGLGGPSMGPGAGGPGGSPVTAVPAAPPSPSLPSIPSMPSSPESDPFSSPGSSPPSTPSNSSAPSTPSSGPSSPSAPSTPASPAAPSAPSTPSAPPSPSSPSGSTPTSGAGKPTEIPPATGKVIVNEPIVVKAGQTFNGEGKLYQAGPSLGDGGQSETQKPVFILESGAKLENVQVAGGDGIHTRGDATLKNVWWKDVGEDAMTMKGPGHVQVIGGGAYAATDKIFQINAPGSLSIDGFTADGFGKAVRTNGGHDFPISIDIRNSVFRNGDEAVVRSDAKDAKINIGSDVVIENTPHKVLAPATADVQGVGAWDYKPYSG